MAFIDARTLSDGHAIIADLCIIGAGAAGLALASQFTDSSLRIALLESGGLTPDPESQSLYEGKLVGQRDAALHESRLRFFGGTTNHWSAHVRPLEPIDFESRDWIPHSGWPIGARDLAPFYARAQEFLHLPSHAFDVRARARAVGHEPWSFHENRVTSQVIRIVDEEHRRFGETHRREIESSQNIQAYLNANVLELQLNDSEKRISSLTVGTLNGRRLTARASHYVLSAGGIENARLLLLSTKRGLGNEHDLVGRFYANHLESGIGQLAPSTQDLSGVFYQKSPAPQAAYGALRLSDKAQADARVSNIRIQLRRSRFRPRSDLDLGVPGVAMSMAAVSAAGDSRRPGKRGGRENSARGFNLHAIVEPIPNPDSRVRLGADRDVFDQRKVVLDWRFSEFDSASVHRTMDRLGVAMGASGIGRVKNWFPEDGFASANPMGSFHHMGTTRMHADPKQGVVDANCRLHAASNLHLAGSSIFPTAGTANPTITILALVFRLADHLKELLA